MNLPRVVLKRFFYTDDVTIGGVFIDGEFQCFTLEDTYHQDKIKGSTRIPAGTYAIKRAFAGRKYTQYRKRFPELPPGVLYLDNVPNFTGIMIHIGNFARDTSGCILVGLNVMSKRNTLMLNRSTPAYKDLYLKIVGMLKTDIFLSIEVIDEDD